MIKRAIIPFLLVIFFVVRGTSQTIEVKGSVEGDWSVDTVKVTGDITIPKEAVLKISPGVLVQFQGHFRWSIFGALQAVGKEGNPVVITIANSSGFDDYETTEGGWNGIYIQGDAEQDSIIFEHCRISYSKAAGADSLDKYCGAIYADNHQKIRISRSEISDNYCEKQGAGIALHHSTAVIEHCTLKNNIAGKEEGGAEFGAALNAHKSTITLSNSLIANNWSMRVGGAIFLSECPHAEFHHNIFTGNEGSTGGVFFLTGCDYALFSNCLFYENHGRYFGGVGSGKEGYLQFINCTSTRNYGGQGGAIYMSSDVLFDFFNCIFYDDAAGGNGPEIYIAYASSTGSFLNCNVKGGLEDFGGGGVGEGVFWGKFDDCIDVDPRFEDASLSNFKLRDNSPCVNQGSIKFIEDKIAEFDLAGNPRTVRGVIDIGAYENQEGVSIKPLTKDNEWITISYHAEAFHFSSEKTIREIQLYDLQGGLAARYQPNINVGSVSFRKTTQQPAIYIVRVLADDGVVFRKKMIVR